VLFAPRVSRSPPARQLDRTLKTRREGAKKKAVIERSKQAKAHKAKSGAAGRQSGADAALAGSAGEDESDAESDAAGPMGVDEFLGGGFEAGMGGDEDDESDDEDDESEGDDLEDMEELSGECLAYSIAAARR
jgi:hypothetical protein